MKRGRYNDARRSLCRVRGVTVNEHDTFVEHDHAEIRESIEVENELGKGTWAETFGRRLRKRTILGMLLQMFQQRVLDDSPIALAV